MEKISSHLQAFVRVRMQHRFRHPPPVLIPLAKLRARMHSKATCSIPVSKPLMASAAAHVSALASRCRPPTQGGAAAPIVIEGDAGIGKTRLLHAIIEDLLPEQLRGAPAGPLRRRRFARTRPASQPAR